MLVALLTLAALASRPQPTITPLDPLNAPIDETEARLLADLKTLPAKRAALGDAEHRAGLIKTEEWLKDRLKAAGLPWTTQEFVWTSPALKSALGGKDAPEPAADDERFKFRNYIVDLPGEWRSQVLILAAHYDAVPNAPGADDDGSGVVGLIEIGRRLKDGKRPRSIRLIFFTLEEVGLVGSMQYVKSKREDWTAPPSESAPLKPGELPGQPAARYANESIDGMISLECIGYFSDKEGSQISPIPKIGGKPILDLKIPDAGSFIGVGGVLSHREHFSLPLVEAMKKAEPTLEILAADTLPIAPPDFLRSDHAPFLLNGKPAVILTDTANFRNPNYHKPTDSVDTLDIKRLAMVVRAVAGAADTLAQRPYDRK